MKQSSARIITLGLALSFGHIAYAKTIEVTCCDELALRNTVLTAKSGDTVHIHAGTYMTKGTIVVPPGVTLRGDTVVYDADPNDGLNAPTAAAPGGTIIDGTFIDDAWAENDDYDDNGNYLGYHCVNGMGRIITVNKGNARISHLHLRGGGVLVQDPVTKHWGATTAGTNGIFATPGVGNSITIDGNYFENLGFKGVWLQNGFNATITGNLVISYATTLGAAGIDITSRTTDQISKCNPQPAAPARTDSYVVFTDNFVQSAQGGANFTGGGNASNAHLSGIASGNRIEGHPGYPFDEVKGKYLPNAPLSDWPWGVFPNALAFTAGSTGNAEASDNSLTMLVDGNLIENFMPTNLTPTTLDGIGMGLFGNNGANAITASDAVDSIGGILANRNRLDLTITGNRIKNINGQAISFFGIFSFFSRIPDWGIFTSPSTGNRADLFVFGNQIDLVKTGGQWGLFGAVGQFLGFDPGPVGTDNSFNVTLLLNSIAGPPVPLNVCADKVAETTTLKCFGQGCAKAICPSP